MENTKILAIFMALLGGVSQMVQAGPTGVTGNPPPTALQSTAGQMQEPRLGIHPASMSAGAKPPLLVSAAPQSTSVPALPAANASGTLSMDPSLMADTSEGGPVGEAGLEDMGASSESMPASESPAMLINTIIEKATELKKQIAPETAALEEGMGNPDMAALQSGAEGSEGLMPAGGTAAVGPHPFTANAQNAPQPPHLAPKPTAPTM